MSDLREFFAERVGNDIRIGWFGTRPFKIQVPEELDLAAAYRFVAARLSKLVNQYPEAQKLDGLNAARMLEDLAAAAEKGKPAAP